MALKKSDLYSSLWSSADELRGSMDASQYKDYILTLLFVKYVSDKAKADSYALIEVPEDGSFDYLTTLKGRPDVGEKVNVAIRKLAEANNLNGVINNADFDDPTKLGSGKDLQDKVSNLIGIFQDMDFSGSKAEGDDLLGDAYEYLMRHFATQSGKSKGQFYTPAEVSRVMAQLLQIPLGTPKSTTVYDPTCGSGSLLIKVADVAPNGLTIYGQENDNATWALARMNMILHANETHEILQGNTLADPKFRENDRLTTFDYLVANPPFSVKTWKNGVEKDYGRFDGFATPPDKNGDYAFLLHMVKSLKSTGKGVVVLPHGVLFRSNTEAQIRQELVKRGYIKAIVGLPANLFYGTGIPACLVVLDKKDAAGRTGIFMIDASKGFEKDGPKNRLRPRDMHKIVDTFVNQKEIQRFSRMVPLKEIADPKNDYNLNIPRYIDSSEPEDIQDLRAHLQGGIPNRDLDALQPYWDAFPSLRAELFMSLREGYSELAVDKADIQATITGSSEYQAFAGGTTDTVAKWWASHRKMLVDITSSTRPNDLIEELSEALLAAFRPRPLIDEYGVYEQLMSYWNASMHDDVALIVGEGWDPAAKPRPARSWKDKNNKAKYEDSHFVFGTGTNARRWVMDLIPPEHVIARFFPKDKAKLDELVVKQETAAQAVEEYVEEHAVEDGLLWDAADDDGKVTAKLVKDHLKAAKAEKAEAEEIEALHQAVKLFAAEAAAKKAVKDATIKLHEQALAYYGKLTTEDIQALVIDDKWGGTIRSRIGAEVTALRQALIARLRVLAGRYERTVAEIDASVETLSAKVAGHLAAMGVKGLTGRTLAGSGAGAWPTVRLLDLVTIASGQVDPRRPEFRDLPLIAPDHIESGTGRLLAVKTAAEQGAISGKYLAEPGDVIYSKIRPYLRKAHVARFRTLCSADMYPLRPKSGVDPEFVLNTLLGARFTDFAASASMRSGIPKINRVDLAAFELAAPPSEEQQEIAEVLLDADAEIAALECRLESARAIKTGMMQQLLTGRTRLPVEAAS